MDVQVNSTEWNGINAEMQEKIRTIIKSNFPDVDLVPSEAAPGSESALSQRSIQSFNLKNPLCTAACGVAEAAAVAACSALSGGVAIAACIAAAHEAGNYCRSRC